MNKKVRTGLIVACVIVITVVMVAVINSKGKKSSAMVGGQGASRRSGQRGAITVRSEVAEVKTLNDYVITNGEVESQRLQKYMLCLARMLKKVR